MIVREWLARFLVVNGAMEKNGNGENEAPL